MKITNANANLLNICFVQMLSTSNKLSGGVIFNFNRNVSLLKPFLEDIDSTRKKIIDQHVDKDENGKATFKPKKDEDSPQEYSFTKENEKIANDEIKELFDTEVEINFIKLPLSKFETLSLDTSKVPGLDVFIEYMIDEDK